MRKEEGIRLLEGEECLEAEGLWRQVFAEDTAAFTDYYFSRKAARNRGLVLEGPEGIRAMLYLTPQRMCAAGRQVDSAYIVGVATRPDCGGRGYMSALLREALSLLWREGVPFAFLMPASPAIYEPFGFVWIYDRPVWDASAFDPSALRKMGPEDAGRMALFAERFLRREKEVYVRRDGAYYREKLEEARAQAGGIYGFELPGERGEKELAGLFYHTREEGVSELLEVLAEPGIERRFAGERLGETPAIMARAVHAGALLSLLRSEEPAEFLIRIRDPFLPGNDGLFLCRADGSGCRAQRQEEGGTGEGLRADLTLTAGELTAFAFGRKDLQSAPGKPAFLSPVWINEIV